MTPTTTTLFPPPPPPGKCIEDGFYRPGAFDGKYIYQNMGTGLCVDDVKLAISFKKRRELTEKNFACVCKEACDREPDCLGYSTNENDDGMGLACRIYGKSAFPTLVDRWLDLGSMKSPMYKGEKIVEGDGEKGMTCYKRKNAGGDFLQMQAFVPVPPPQVSFISRQTSTAEILEWQREQLAGCRNEQGKLLSHLQETECPGFSRSSFLQRGRASASSRVMPNECQCHCPDCNFWQMPPPVCLEPTAPPTATVPPLPPGVIVVTGPPRQPTPPPMPVQIPLPPLPPIGNQFLPTLGPPPP
jgi:hypothetical protein